MEVFKCMESAGILPLFAACTKCGPNRWSEVGGIAALFTGSTPSLRSTKGDKCKPSHRAQQPK
jgi:hypothetical protein